MKTDTAIKKANISKRAYEECVSDLMEDHRDIDVMERMTNIRKYVKRLILTKSIPCTPYRKMFYTEEFEAIMRNKRENGGGRQKLMFE